MKSWLKVLLRKWRQPKENKKREGDCRRLLFKKLVNRALPQLRAVKEQAVSNSHTSESTLLILVWLRDLIREDKVLKGKDSKLTRAEGLRNQRLTTDLSPFKIRHLKGT